MWPGATFRAKADISAVSAVDPFLHRGRAHTHAARQVRLAEPKAPEALDLPVCLRSTHCGHSQPVTRVGAGPISRPSSSADAESIAITPGIISSTNSTNSTN
jgi:hypothetical protein